MLPDPKIVTLVISAPIVVSQSARFGCCYNYNMVVATTNCEQAHAVHCRGRAASIRLSSESLLQDATTTHLHLTACDKAETARSNVPCAGTGPRPGCPSVSHAR